MEMVGQAITMVSVISERRLNRLENPALSQGLPDFLTPDPGFYSGLMLSQYAADMLIVEQRILAAPAATICNEVSAVRKLTNQPTSVPCTARKNSPATLVNQRSRLASACRSAAPLLAAREDSRR